MSIKILDTGLIYANPRPFLRSRQAAFPTVVPLGSSELLAAFTVGEAFESADGHTELARSVDGGCTWTHEGPQAHAPTPSPTSESGRLSRTADGAVLCLAPRYDRSDPERSIGNGETNGMLDCEAVWYRSEDGGRTWGEANVIPIPIPGAYEIAAPIVVLRDGRWLAPFSNFPDWNGHSAAPEQARAMVSYDQGATWPEVLTILADPNERVVFWEQRIQELEGGTGSPRLLALAWAHDRTTGKDLSDHFSFSEDGVHFSAPQSTGIPGQTCSPAWLGDGCVLCVYNHRAGEAGVRARLCRFRPDAEWDSLEEITVWGQPPALAARDRGSAVAQMNYLRFGFPMVLPLAESQFLVSHWCMEDAQLVCRWTRLAVQ